MAEAGAPHIDLMDGEFYALSNEIGQRALGTEYYTLLAGPSAPSGRPDGEGGRRPGDPFERGLFRR